MDRIIIEVGSTVTKIDKFDKTKLDKIKKINKLFKKNYIENKKIINSDLDILINNIKNLKQKYKDIYICGTSIFRTLSQEEKEFILSKIKKETGCDFHIISEDDESRLTVLGTTRFINEKVCVFIGGGGSTEIAIYDKKIKSNINTSFGVIDVMKKFEDLGNDIATTPLEDVMDFIRKHLNIPNDKADILILAGGGHEKFARYSGIKYEKNTLYDDICAPIMMDIKTRIEETKRYYKEISLDEIRSRTEDPDWWYATRAMCAFVLVVAEAIDAKYIVPTNIGMAYGILESQK